MPKPGTRLTGTSSFLDAHYSWTSDRDDRECAGVSGPRGFPGEAIPRRLSGLVWIALNLRVGPPPSRQRPSGSAAPPTRSLEAALGPLTATRRSKPCGWRISRQLGLLVNS